MGIDITADPTRFLAAAEPFLRRDSLRHTVIATAAANARSGRTAGTTIRFLTVRDAAGAVTGAATTTTEGAVYLGELPADSIPEVAAALLADGVSVRSVEGAEVDAAAFVSGWPAATARYSVRLFRLGTLSVPETAGTPRRATVDDVDTCLSFATEFSRAIGDPPRFGAAGVRQRIEAGLWWLWERDGVPVTLVARQAEVFGWARIGPVYTPPQLRGNGFASALTATVSAVIRAEGADACLFADLANPTSNKIYRAIGYEPVRDFTHYTV
ncbi:GNAT family N-acetyltransferase [Nocardia rhizosphaerae]|uniref:GNAT family N-acetyltransferase n=1 Tax=Nocardia rhizosphaerae TaxID=1691571 RepID=A0ABV8L3M1_9NOCA